MLLEHMKSLLIVTAMILLKVMMSVLKSVTLEREVCLPSAPVIMVLVGNVNMLLQLSFICTGTLQIYNMKVS